jgi:hypothetical protein
LRRPIPCGIRTDQMTAALLRLQLRNFPSARLSQRISS